MVEITRLSRFTPRKTTAATRFGALYQEVRPTLALLSGQLVSDSLLLKVVLTAHALTFNSITVTEQDINCDPSPHGPPTATDFHETFAFAHFVGLPIAAFAARHDQQAVTVMAWVKGKASVNEAFRAPWIDHAASALHDLNAPMHPPIHYLRRAFAP